MVALLDDECPASGRSEPEIWIVSCSVFVGSSVYHWFLLIHLGRFWFLCHFCGSCMAEPLGPLETPREVL